MSKRCKIRPRLLLMTNRKSHTPLRLVPKSTTLDDPEWPLCTLLHKICAFRSPPRKFKCGYSRGFLGDEASNGSGVIENVDFQGFRTLRLRHLRKWGQRYYIVLFSPLSPFHWPHNTWPWMTMNGHFTLNFHYYEQPFDKLFYILTV